jgi:triosephosphate isomerase
VRARTHLLTPQAKFFVGGNWKCNGTHASVERLVSDLNAGDVPFDIDVVVAPPFIFLDWVNANITRQFQVAAQNCWVKSDGAFTGEISAEMLNDARVPWVITGHSERRSLCGESNTFVGQKTGHALDVGLKVCWRGAGGGGCGAAGPAPAAAARAAAAALVCAPHGWCRPSRTHSHLRHTPVALADARGGRRRPVAARCVCAQVIACIGETLDQRNGGNLWHTLDRQMQALFENINDWSRVVIAYEPVWAIGTGQVASPAQAQEVRRARVS